MDATSDFCEHYFAWLATVLVNRVNELFQEQGFDLEVCAELGVFIRHGVTSLLAVELLSSGVRSRELANAIAHQATIEEVEGLAIRSWLGGLTFEVWREKFAATPLDLVDLIEYARPRNTSLLRDLLVDEECRVEVAELTLSAEHYEAVDVRPTGPERELVPLGVYGLAGDGSHDVEGGELIGYIPAHSHADVELIISSGLELEMSLDAEGLLIRLATAV